MKVVVTRAGEGTERLAKRLLAAGFEVVECPLVRIEPLGGGPLRVEGYDWIVLTSRNAVDCLFDRLEGGLPAVAAVGPGTAEALRAHGVEPAVVARRSTQEGLVEELLPRSRSPSARVLFAGAEDARRELVHRLGADFVPLYRTVPMRPLRLPEGDLIVLASASAARSLAALGARLPCVSIGPVTTEAARLLGLDVIAEAASHDLDGLVEAVRLAASRLASSRS